MEVAIFREVFMARNCGTRERDVVFMEWHCNFHAVREAFRVGGVLRRPFVHHVERTCFDGVCKESMLVVRRLVKSGEVRTASSSRVRFAAYYFR